MELHNKAHIWDSSENTQIIAEQIQNRHSKYPEVWHSNHNMELFYGGTSPEINRRSRKKQEGRTTEIERKDKNITELKPKQQLDESLSFVSASSQKNRHETWRVVTCGNKCVINSPIAHGLK